MFSISILTMEQSAYLCVWFVLWQYGKMLAFVQDVLYLHVGFECVGLYLYIFGQLVIAHLTKLMSQCPHSKLLEFVDLWVDL